MPEPEPRSIVLYAQPTDPYSRQAYDFLTRRKVEFTAYDVSQDPLAMEEMVRISGQHDVPVIVIGDEVIVGFDLSRLNQLLPSFEPPRVQLGVSIANVKASDAHPEGVLVGAVREGSLAERAGLKKGDIITEVAQQPVKSASDVPAALAGLLPGAQVVLAVWRGGRVFRAAIRV